MRNTTDLTPLIPNHNAPSNLLPGDGELPDTISAWAERYFATEVTTGERSRKEQARDFRLFIGFLQNVIGSEQRLDWTPRVSREGTVNLASAGLPWRAAAGIGPV